jgi:hypothetical protein
MGIEITCDWCGEPVKHDCQVVTMVRGRGRLAAALLFHGRRGDACYGAFVDAVQDLASADHERVPADDVRSNEYKGEFAQPFERAQLRDAWRASDTFKTLRDSWRPVPGISHQVAHRLADAGMDPEQMRALLASGELPFLDGVAFRSIEAIRAYFAAHPPADSHDGR